MYTIRVGGYGPPIILNWEDDMDRMDGDMDRMEGDMDRKYCTIIVLHSK